jgi:hypothetical protein
MGAVERLGSARGSLFAPSFEGRALNTPVDVFGEANAKRPFTSILAGGSVKTEIIPPTGEIDVFGFKATIPFLAPFQQPITKTTITGAPREQKSMGAIMAGRDDFSFKLATSMDTFGAAPWVPSKGEVAVGAAMLGVPFAVGLPVISTRFNPATGETETITEQAYEQTATQKFETWDMSKGTVTPITTTFAPGMSAFQNFNKFVSDKYLKPYTPTPEQATRSGYAFLRVGKIVEGKGRVISPADAASFEKNSPMAAAGVKYFTEGWYAGLREEPVTFGLSYGVGLGLGAAFRMGGEALPLVSRVAGPTATKALSFMGGKALPAAMVGYYGFDVSSRTTEGFTNYNPTSMAIKSGRITSTEIMPGMVGFGHGGRLVSGGISTGKAVYEDYLALKTIAKGQNLADIPTYGRPGIGEIKYTPVDYGTYKAQKFIAETKGRAAIFGENAMDAYIEAKVLTKPRLQVAATNTISEIYGKYYQARGYGEYSIPTEKPSPFVGKSAISEPFTSSPKLSPVERMGTKIVGGSKVSGLRPEPSMKSMGIKEVSSGLGGTDKPYFKGRATDYRNLPRGAMKPMTKLQSAMLYPQEQMPQFAAPKVKTGLVGDIVVMHDVQPSFMGQSSQKMGLVSVSDVMRQSFGLSLVSVAAQRQQFGQIQKDLADTMVVSAQKSRQFQEQMTDVFQTQRDRYGLMSVQAFQQDLARTPEQTQRFVQNQIFKTDQRSRQAIVSSSLSSQIQDQFSKTVQSQKTSQITEQITKPWTETTTRRVPLIGFPPFPMGGGGRGFGMRIASPWSRKNLVGAELFMTRKKKGRSFRPPF